MPKQQRRKERELALLTLFEKNFTGDESRPSEEIAEDFSDQEHLKGINNISGEYAKKIVDSYNENSKEIDSLIEKYLKEGWRLDKLPLAERAILEIGTTELLKLNLPKEIAINEAIVLAQKYGEDKSKSYINGILNNIAQEIEAENN